MTNNSVCTDIDFIDQFIDIDDNIRINTYTTTTTLNTTSTMIRQVKTTETYKLNSLFGIIKKY
jgi:hypothetical protein